MKTEKNKLRSMREAVADSVQHGCMLYVEGFTHLICFAAGHEIIRQEKRNLVAARLTPDLVYDQLIEAGCVKKLVFSWAGNPGVGSLHALRRKTEGQGDRIELEEYSHFGMVGRLLAGSAGLPFWPLRNYQLSNISDVNDKIRRVTCPYTGEELATVPALNPDVAIIHCQRADREGNGQVWGLMGTQKEAAFAAKRVVLVAEEIVDSRIIRQDPNRTLIPSIVVDHVVHEPWGAHPSYVQGHYDRDNDFYVAWDQISRAPETYRNYLDEFVWSVKNRGEYTRKLDVGILAKLTAKSKLCSGVDYGY